MKWLAYIINCNLITPFWVEIFVEFLNPKKFINLHLSTPLWNDIFTRSDQNVILSDFCWLSGQLLPDSLTNLYSRQISSTFSRPFCPFAIRSILSSLAILKLSPKQSVIIWSKVSYWSRHAKRQTDEATTPWFTSVVFHGISSNSTRNERFNSIHFNKSFLFACNASLESIA